MATITELMTGKQPGEIRVTCCGFDKGSWFQPYFQNKHGDWFGLCSESWGVSYSQNYMTNGWQLYTEPKAKVVRWLWANLDDVDGWEQDKWFMNETEAQTYYGEMSYRKCPWSATEFDE